MKAEKPQRNPYHTLSPDERAFWDALNKSSRTLLISHPVLGYVESIKTRFDFTALCVYADWLEEPDHQDRNWAIAPGLRLMGETGLFPHRDWDPTWFLAKLRDSSLRHPVFADLPENWFGHLLGHTRIQKEPQYRRYCEYHSIAEAYWWAAVAFSKLSAQEQEDICQQLRQNSTSQTAS